MRFPDASNPSAEKEDQTDDAEAKDSARNSGIRSAGIIQSTNASNVDDEERTVNSMPLAVRAAILAESTDPRERSAGLAVLDKLLRRDDAETATPMDPNAD